METSRSASVRPDTVRSTRTIPRFVYLGYLLLVLFGLLFTSELMIMAATDSFYPSQESNPFADFEAIMPGQPAAILEQYSRTCQIVIPSEHNSIVCHIARYDSVSVTVGIQKDVIYSLSIKGYDWHFEDLVMRWGIPASIKPIKGFVVTDYSEGAVSVKWSDLHAHAALAPLSAGHLWSQHTPVWYVHIESGE